VLAPFFAAVGVLACVDSAFGCSTKAMAYRAALKSDLRNLVSAQESFHGSFGRYTTDLRALGFKNSTGVLPIQFDHVNEAGWSATVRHAFLDFPCHVYVGERPSAAPAEVAEGEPWCAPSYAWYADERFGSPLSFGILIMLVVFTITARLMFKTPDGKTNWAAVGLLLATLLQVFMIASISWCGDGLLPASVPALAIGTTIFVLALRNRLRAFP
jgi:hypothetical protein